MTNTPDNDRHERALEAAVHADGFTPSAADRNVVARAIAAYLRAMDAVIVPREPTREMWAAMADSLYRYKNRHHDKVVADLLNAMFASAPHHFNQEGK